MPYRRSVGVVEVRGFHCDKQVSSASLLSQLTFNSRSRDDDDLESALLAGFELISSSTVEPSFERPGKQIQNNMFCSSN
jgi:hypothetical protein